MYDDPKPDELVQGFENKTCTVQEFNAMDNTQKRFFTSGPCQHKNTRLVKEGMTGMLGTVICTDCGHEREWNAY